MEKIAIVGAGNLGTALGILLKELGYPLVGVVSRTVESARRGGEALEAPWDTAYMPLLGGAGVIFITTPDRAIAPVCREMAGAGAFKPGDLVIHTSGAHSSEILGPAREKGAAVMSVHPLQTVPSPQAGVRNLPGSYFAVEGDGEGLPLVRGVIAGLGGHLVEVPTGLKPLYHASACVVSNYFVAVVRLGLSMMERIGLEKEEALAALLPLIQGTMQNIREVGVPQGLTGPISRGDAPTLQGHLEVMARSMPEIIPLYRELGRYTVQVSLEKGSLDRGQAEQVIKALEVPEKNV